MQPSYQSGFYAPGRGVAKHPELWRGCVGAWNPGLGNTGLSLRDWSGNQNNGTLTNGPTWGVTDGQQALTFDGVNDYVDTNAHLLSNVTALTVCFFAKPTATNKRMEVCEGTNGSIRAGYGLAEDGNTYILPASTGGYGYADWAYLGVSKFIHFCAVFDGSQSGNANRAKLYLNGTQKTLLFIGAVPASVGSFTGNTRFGVRPTDTFYSEGFMADTRIYNRALPPNEIRTLAKRPGIAYELAPRKTYFIQAATSTSQFYDVLSPLIFAGTN